MYIIARFVNNISLNGYEYVMDDNNEVMRFDTKENAVNFLNEKTGNTHTELEYYEEGIYIESEEENK